MQKLYPNINLLSSNLVFIGGVTRSGKSFLCPIVSSFKKCEMFFMNSFAENVSYINKLKGINSDYSKYLIKLIFNETIYNINIGRNLNQRNNDYTSIQKYRNPNVYYKRMRGPEGENIIKKIKKNKNFYPVMFHDVLINPELLLESFKNSKIIFIDRHPVDLLDEWIKKKYSGSFFKNPRNVTLSFNFRGSNYPYWCKKYLNKVFKANNKHIKTVYLLSELILKQKKIFKKLTNKHKRRVKIVKFDELIENTNFEIKKIAKFMKTKPSRKTIQEITKQNGNRNINLNLRNKIKNQITKNLNHETKFLLNILEERYLLKS